MSDMERAEAKSLHLSLTSLLSPDHPFDGKDGEMAKGALLTKLIRGLAGASEMSDIVAAAKIEMYADAVTDIPAWAIDKAVKRWARGSCPADIEERPKFSFPPAPATLRGIAKLEMETPRRQLDMLANLIAAVERALDPAPIMATAGVLPALRRM